MNLFAASDEATRLVEAATSRKRVSSLTHGFYRYPARFSPLLIREVIDQFSSVGDLVIDPFVGGGTTAVEARVLGRRFLGTDINALAAFVSSVKANPLKSNDIKAIQGWIGTISGHLKLRHKANFSENWEHYYKNIEDKHTWPIKKSIQLALETLVKYAPRQQRFIRCCILNASQQALDAKKYIPKASEFRSRLITTSLKMLEQIEEYSSCVRKADQEWIKGSTDRTKIINRSIIGLEETSVFSKYNAPKLIVTSPPYPGVHVLYHRWQVLGRKETPAPYWIANALDGAGESHYTFGGRHDNTFESYFTNVYKSFSSLAQLSNRSTHIVQIIGFSEPSWQLPLYLETLEDAGLQEIQFRKLANHRDGRLWRQVPNRKWYASQRGTTHGSKEVILIHKLAR